MEVLEKIMVNPVLLSVEKDIGELYELAFPHVAAFVRKMGGSLDDAKDIFHDALVIFYEQTKDKDFTVKNAPEAYLLGIAKHLWIRKFKRDRKRVSLDDTELSITIPDDHFPDVSSKHLLSFLEQAGKKCLDLLRAFYYEKLSVGKIAANLGYASEHSASVQKYKCLEKVRDTVKEKSLSYEDFTE